MNINGIFFDLFGTLYVQGNMTAELEDWITELYLHLVRSGFKGTRDEVMSYWQQRMRKESPPKPDNGMTIFERRIQITCSDLGVTMTRTEIEGTAKACLSVWDKYFLIDPVSISLLSSLNKKGKVTALISNFDHPQHVHNLVRSTSMKDYFSIVVVSGDYGIKKPDPAIFRMALQKTGMVPSETAYVGDSEEDMVGANEAGLISVLIDRNGHGRDYGQKYKIKTLHEIIPIFI